MLDLNRARSFVTVVDTGSFTGAARALRITKAAVSLHVKQLEAELGTELLVRTTRSVVATAAGERFHRAATRLVQGAERAMVEARGANESLDGTLRIDAVAEYLTHVLATPIAAFAALHPRLVLDLTASNSLSNLVRQRIDLAIRLRLGRLPDSTLHARKLGEFRVFPVATPELLARHGVVRTPDDLSRLPWILHYSVHDELQLDGPVPRTITLAPRIRTDSAATMRQLALTHVGATFAAPWTVRADLEVGTLVRLIPDYALPCTSVYAVRPRAGRVSAKVARFVDFLADYLAEAGAGHSIMHSRSETLAR